MPRRRPRRFWRRAPAPSRGIWPCQGKTHQQKHTEIMPPGALKRQSPGPYDAKERFDNARDAALTAMQILARAKSETRDTELLHNIAGFEKLDSDYLKDRSQQ